MRLSELVSSLDLWIYPAVGLLLFFLVFAAVTVRVLRTPKAEAAAQGRLPLEDGTVGDGTEASR